MTDDTSNIAAKYCNDYTTAGTSAGDWYLPAIGELSGSLSSNNDAITSTLSKLGWGWQDGWLWSSSEYNETNAWFSNVTYGSAGYGSRAFGGHYVSCFLAL